jgi:threonine dehydratase
MAGEGPEAVEILEETPETAQDRVLGRVVAPSGVGGASVCAGRRSLGGREAMYPR